MAKLTATISTTEEVKLEPKLRQRLVKELNTYAALRDQLKALQHSMEKKKQIIGELRAETDAQSISINGFTVSLVAPIRHKFSPKLFASNGGDLEIYNQSFEDVPTNSYEKITCPGSGDDE